ncbi:MAG: DNA topoisomerase VI subunit B [Nanobdellota archaeon]
MATKNTAEDMASKQRDISISEFFAKNRHLLGFDSKRKALLTTIKEAVDNSLDACEEARILPELSIEIIEMGNDRYRIIVEDNGPGIVKKQIPNIFAKLLYGSKFHKLAQSRGQQGIGISASVMYAQLTTGRPVKITSKTAPDEPANYNELQIETQKNKPQLLNSQTVEWHKNHGTRIEMDLEGSYYKGAQSVDEYIKQTAITNPHVTIIYTNPKAEQLIFTRGTENLPAEPKEIKPHPYGVEIGFLMKMMRWTDARTLQSFLTNEFSRIGEGTAKTICENAALLPNTKPKNMNRDMAEQLINGIKKTKIISPPTDCISPIGEDLLLKGLKKEINAEFYTSVSRPPNVYRGNPFQIEAAIAYGGQQESEGPINILRYANRVPLLYQQGACGATKAIINTSWKNYGLSQSNGSLPQGPITIVIHISSVWVPFTSESKEAIAHYPEILKEMKLCIQECGRKLGGYIKKKKNVGKELKKRSYIQKYLPHVVESLGEILELSKADQDRTTENLKGILEEKRGKVDDMKFDPNQNKEYDEDIANIGKGDEDE